MLESAYEECLCYELKTHAIPHQRQVALPIRYKEIALEAGYRLDIVVDQRLILELKTAERLLPVHDAQLLTYLRLSGIKVGLIMNFNVPVLRQGIRRLVL